MGPRENCGDKRNHACKCRIGESLWACVYRKIQASAQRGCEMGRTHKDRHVAPRELYQGKRLRDTSRLDITKSGSRGCMCRRAQQNNRHADTGREVTSVWWADPKRTVRCGSISRRGFPYYQSV